jgi:mn2+, zn2+ ABC superfamily ATP binding cassette transporter, membrane protein
MLVDAMGHAAFPGVVLAAIVWPIGSPLLVLGAAALALVVVASAEGLSRTGLVAGDAAQGLVFPGLFSVGVILLSTRFSHLHLQEEAVLVGDPNVVAVDRLIIAGRDFGPVYCYAMGAVLLLNVLFLAATHRRLALVVFDPDYARTLGVPVRGLRGAAMALVALTLTASFYTAGAVLVIAFVVVPAATAALVADSFPRLVQGSAAIAALVAGSPPFPPRAGGGGAAGGGAGEAGSGRRPWRFPPSSPRTGRDARRPRGQLWPTVWCSSPSTRQCACRGGGGDRGV